MKMYVYTRTCNQIFLFVFPFLVWGIKSGAHACYTNVLPLSYIPGLYSNLDSSIIHNSNMGPCVQSPMPKAQLIDKKWTEPTCPLTDETIRKMWYIHIMEYYLAVKMNKTFDTYYNMDKPWKNYTKWKKPFTKDYEKTTHTIPFI
jgi:hypothetical protein